MFVNEAVRKVKNDEVPVLKEPTIKESIHSARKTGYNYGGRGKGSSGGRGLGSGSRGSRDLGRSRGISKGQGRGRVR